MRVARPETAGSQSLERGLAILASFRSAQPLLGVSDLSRRVGLSRSTTHRYVATLAALGYLQQDADTKKYRLGPRVLDLGFSAINSMELRHVSAPHLKALSREDRPHGEHGGARRHRDRLHRALPGPATRARSTSTSTSARDCRRTAPRWARCCSHSFPRPSSSALLNDADLRAPRPEHDHRRSAHCCRSSSRYAHRAWPSTTRSSPTVCARSLRPCASQTGEVVAAINLAVHRSLVSMDELFEDLAPALVHTAAEIAAHAGFREVVTYGRR